MNQILISVCWSLFYIMSTFTTGYITHIYSVVRLLQIYNDNNIVVKLKMTLQQYDRVPILQQKNPV